MAPPGNRKKTSNRVWVWFVFCPIGITEAGNFDAVAFSKNNAQMFRTFQMSSNEHGRILVLYTGHIDAAG